MKIYKEFKVYFENETNLKLTVNTGFLIYYYNAFCRDYKNSIFEAFLLTIIEIYRAAKHKNQTECISFLQTHEPTISQAFRNTTAVVHTEQHKDIIRLNFYAKVCFRELGDFIEGSFKPFIKELLGLHLLNKKTCPEVIEIISQISLGDAVATLVKAYEDLSILYKHALSGVTLNQWRNIANHNSYLVNENANKIICNYGSNDNKKSIALSREDLCRTYLAISKIQYLHQMAHAFFIADNINVMSENRPEVDISGDTAIMQTFESLASKGFKVFEYKKNESEYFLSVIDMESRGKEEIEQSLKEIVPIVFSLLRKLRLNVYNTENIPVFEIKNSHEHVD